MKLLPKSCCTLLVLLIAAGCTLPYQLQTYSSYQFHDLKVKDNGVIVLLGKKRYSPENSIPAAMSSHIPTRNDFEVMSYALLTFYMDNFNNDIGHKELAPSSIKNIITKKNLGKFNKYLRHSIVDENHIFSLYDFINMELCVSVIDINNEIHAEHVICNRKSKLNMLDFKNKFYLFSINNKGILSDLMRMKTREYVPVVPLESLSQHFKNTLYMSGDGRWFFDQIGEDLATSSFIFELVDKENDVVISKFSSKSRNFQDFNNKIRDGKILTHNSRNGLEIIDINGVLLYHLLDDSSRSIKRAVLHEDKVYAAGITTRDSPLGKKEYIEIIQWDYINDSVIKKYYPCDSPELEM